jgi:hypothetical protein
LDRALFVRRVAPFDTPVGKTWPGERFSRRTGDADGPGHGFTPRDKAKVDVGVQVAQRWILARLRNQRFFSLAELNRTIRDLPGQLNDRTLRGWGTTRRAFYEQLDRPALGPLPPGPYEFADWKLCRVNFDYHVEIEKHFY